MYGIPVRLKMNFSEVSTKAQGFLLFKNNKQNNSTISTGTL